jgi:hypothetical protein
MLKKIAVFCILPICAWCTSVRADTITDPTNGVAYTLTYSTTANPNVFDLQLVIDTTNYSKLSTDKLADVALRLVGNGADASDFTLTTSPASYAQPAFGGLASNGGCNGSGAPFFCDNYTGAGYGLSVGAGDVYTFDWMYSGLLDDLMFDSHVKAEFLRSDGRHAGQSAGNTSQDITLTESPTPPVPEPSTLLLMGSGLAAAAAMLRRRWAVAPGAIS